MKTKVFILEMSTDCSSKEVYHADVHCTNCGVNSPHVEIEKGTPVRDAKCPNCGKIGDLRRTD